MPDASEVDLTRYLEAALVGLELTRQKIFKTFKLNPAIEKSLNSIVIQARALQDEVLGGFRDIDRLRDAEAKVAEARLTMERYYASRAAEHVPDPIEPPTLADMIDDAIVAETVPTFDHETPRKWPVEDAAVTINDTVEPGFYKLADKIYRVRKAKRNRDRSYAELVFTFRGETRYTYERGTIFRIKPAHRMSDTAVFAAGLNPKDIPS